MRLLTLNPRCAALLRSAGIDPVKLPAGTMIDGRPIDAAGEAAKALRISVGVAACPNGTVRLDIQGPPPGKPRMTKSDKWRKRSATDKYWVWANAIKVAVAGCIPPAAMVAEVNWTAYFEPPPSWSKKKRVAAIGTRHRSKPDLDNIAKALSDTLWPDDDSAIADGTFRKRWDWTARLEVEIITETP